MSGEPKTLFEVQFDLLMVELKSIESAVRQHDEITKSIKNWAVLTWTASVGIALKEQALQPFLWVTGVVPLLFWVVDGSYRRIQRTFIARVEEISTYLNSPTFRAAFASGGAIGIPVMLMRSRTGRFRDSLLGTMCFRSVALLYLGLTACSLAVWFIKCW